MFNNAPFRPPQLTRAGHHTGMNINNTAASRVTLAQSQATLNSVAVGTANALGRLRNGDVVQFDTNDHEKVAGGTVNALITTSVPGNSGYVVSTPTSGILAPLAVVADVPPDVVNEAHPNATAANLRKRGGPVQLVTSGFAYIRVRANCVKGATLLSGEVGASYLIACTATTVAHLLARLGANSAPFALAMETIDHSATVNGGLVYCQIVQPPI